VINLVIETEKLTKIYGSKTGCRDVSISVGNGEIFAFLGPNGAGKSTLVKMLTGLLHPTSGSAVILGKPLGDVKARERIGYLPENFRYQEWMTGEDLLSFHAALYKLDKRKASSKIQEVLELVKLKGQEKYKIGTYSKGMQQRIGIASSILCDPDLIFMDEPTSALDPIGRKDVREIMLELKRQGKTIFLNSHLLGEVELLCDSAAFINKGTIIKQGKMKDILKGKIVLKMHVGGINEAILNRIHELDTNASIEGERITMTVRDDEEIHHMAEFIIKNGGRLYELAPGSENLENIFIRLIEGKADD
jgi:ABC-2 type transport system ATP-binding protein